jgi:hypothetical protein
MKKWYDDWQLEKHNGGAYWVYKISLPNAYIPEVEIVVDHSDIEDKIELAEGIDYLYHYFRKALEQINEMDSSSRTSRESSSEE